MRKFVNVCWFLTFLLFFAALTLSYAYLPENIGIQADEFGTADRFISKETFFYAGLLLFVVSNVVSLYFKRVLDSVPAETDFYFQNENFKQQITAWFGGFVTMINLFLVMAVGYIAIFNSEALAIEDYNLLLFLIPLLLVGNLAWLAGIYAQRHRQQVLD